MRRWIVYKLSTYFWNIGILVVLLTVKLSLVSLLMNSLQKGSCPPGGCYDGKSQKLVHSSTLKSNTRDDHFDFNVPIFPSSTNRTSATSNWLIFNRVPRSGGSTVVELLYELAEINGFKHQSHEYRTPWSRFLTKDEQSNLVMWFEYQHLPISYDRLFLYINFTEFQKYVKETPIYINMMRDPVYQVRSSYFARRNTMQMLQRRSTGRRKDLKRWDREFEDCVLKDGPECSHQKGAQDFTLTIPFFCGQDPQCVLLGNKWALQKAKYNMEKHYSVVGILENLKTSLKIFEAYVPRFFKGVSQLYTGKENEKLQPMMSKKIEAILRKKLSDEIDLYNFACRRLELQMTTLSSKRNKKY